MANQESGLEDLSSTLSLAEDVDIFLKSDLLSDIKAPLRYSLVIRLYRGFLHYNAREFQINHHDGEENPYEKANRGLSVILRSLGLEESQREGPIKSYPLFS